MYERFTDRARKTLTYAAEVARKLSAQTIEPEHVLAGLLWEGSGVGVHAMRTIGVDVRALRRQFSTSFESDCEEYREPRPLKRGPRVRDLLHHAKEEATAIHCNYIGTEHLVLALCRDGSDDAVRDVLHVAGVSYPVLRAQVVKMLLPSTSSSKPEVRASTEGERPHISRHPLIDEESD